MPEPQQYTYVIPLVAGGSVEFRGSFPLLESDWQHMLAVLDAMKPGLVMPQSGPSDGTPDA